MSEPLKRLFVPHEQVGRITVEPRVVTASGTVALFGGRVQPVIERYHRRHQLSHAQYRAGVKLYESYAFGMCGVRQPPNASGRPEDASTSTEALSWQDCRLDAVRAYQRATQRLGERLSFLPVMVCCHDIPVATLAHQRGRPSGRNVTMMMQELRIALDLIAETFGIDKDG
jgi:hypothetical protein